MTLHGTASTRRTFLRTMLAATAAASLRTAHAQQPVGFGVQLYTVRQLVKTDLLETLKKIRAIGYTSVEAFSGMYQQPAAALRQAVEAAGLTLPSAHFAYDTLESMIPYAQDLGVRHMVCAMLPKPLQTPEGFQRAAVEFNRVGALIKARGMRLSFHNHNFEFAPLDPAPTATAAPHTGLDVLLTQTDPAIVGWELDCYWAAQAGSVPLQLIQRHKNRISMLHLKDRAKDATPSFAPGKPSQFFTEIGTGTIAYGPIVRLARDLHLPMFVEQDLTAGDPLESIATSFRALTRLS